jgi:nucleoside-diphosphate-sugar epimerase
VEVARGASTVYHCMNPPYYARVWAELLPRYMENLIAAAGQNGARLVVLDNVYMLGRPQGKPLDEDTPPRPCSRKGEIRARVAERMWEAHRRGDVRATSGRASDFYGPGGR